MSDADEPYRGMVFYEHEAVERALRETREKWLPLLEGRLATTDHPDERAMLTAEIRRLRRLLGIFQTEEARRAASRERVRRHRERKQQGIVRRTWVHRKAYRAALARGDHRVNLDGSDAGPAFGEIRDGEAVDGDERT